jgi:hypothetical protein
MDKTFVVSVSSVSPCLSLSVISMASVSVI